MGNQDNRHAPKQLKIERQSNPRPLRRGILKKGIRKKGRKARLDEIKSAYKNWLWHKDFYEERLKHRDKGPWVESLEKRKNEYRLKYERLFASFEIEYGAVEEGEWVLKKD